MFPNNQCFIEILNFFSVPNLEEEVGKIADKDGWIRVNDYMKFALTTELCKIEFQDRVFQKVDYGEESKSKKKEKVIFF